MNAVFTTTIHQLQRRSLNLYFKRHQLSSSTSSSLPSSSSSSLSTINNEKEQTNKDIVDSSIHQRQNHNRPMVHLSSAPNEKFTGKKIGSFHPIVPHPTTPQRRINSNMIHNRSTKKDMNDTTVHSRSVNLSLPPYAIDGIVVNEQEKGRNNSIVTIHDIETIQKIRKASQLAAEMLQQACDVAQQKPFMTTDEIDQIIHCAILNHKITSTCQSINSNSDIDELDDTKYERVIHAYPSPLNYNHFPKSICCSVNEVICHGIPDLRRLQDGDLLSIDVSVYLDGVHGDNCASIIIGSDDGDMDDAILEQKERAKRLIHATEEAMYAAIDVCRHGTTLNQIGNAVHNIADHYGFRPMKNVCGHGIGKQLHMNPQIKHFRNNDDNIKLQSGMVITIEPALVEGHHAYTTWGDGWSKCTVDGGLSAQFEHTILINEEGAPEILTALQ